jgi:diacylglycerol O-acyltransferase
MLQVGESKPVAAEDAARLGMSTPENPMLITAVLGLEGRLDLDELLALVDARLLVRERLRARIEPRSGLMRAPRWCGVEPAGRRHVESVTLAEGKGLPSLVSELMSVELDPELPPWRAWLVDGVASSWLVFRIHHAVADGRSLLALLFGFADEGAALAGYLDGEGIAARHVRRAQEKAASGVARRALDLARLAFLPRASVPGPRGALTGEKRIAWSGPIELESLRRAAHSGEAHINDVLLASVAGALRELGFEEPVYALVPVAFPQTPASLGNHYVSVFVPLPVGVGASAERVRRARDAMREARKAQATSLGQAFVAAAPLMGTRAERAAVRFISRKASLVVTNLAGPPKKLHLAGHAVREVAFAAPAPGSVGLSVSAFGYAGELRVTIASDVGIFPDPFHIARLVEEQARATVAALAR